METEDLACPLLRYVTLNFDLMEAMKDASAVFILDDVPMETEQGRVDSHANWLKRNVELFQNYAKCINELKLKDAKV